MGLGPATLPADTVNIPYDQKITANGGTGTSMLAGEQHCGCDLRTDGASQRDWKPGHQRLAHDHRHRDLHCHRHLLAGQYDEYQLQHHGQPGRELGPSDAPGRHGEYTLHPTIQAGGGTGTVTLAVSNVKGKISGLTVPTGGTGASKTRLHPQDHRHGDFHGHRHRFAGQHDEHQLQHHGPKQAPVV